MSWLQTPPCLPDETCVELIKSTGNGSSEWNSMVETVCDGLQDNGYTEEEAFRMALCMCETFIECASGLKDLFTEEAEKHGYTIKG